MGRTVCTDPQCLYKGALYLLPMRSTCLFLPILLHFINLIISSEKYNFLTVRFCLLSCHFSRHLTPTPSPLYFHEQKNEPSNKINPLNAELNPICHLLTLLDHHIFHVNGLRVNALHYFNLHIFG
jgi:hypothetical protein